MVFSQNKNKIGLYKKKKDLSNITLMIKTFERPTAIKRLLDSIEKYYGEVEKSLTIMIADDSHEPKMPKGKYRNSIHYLPLPFDMGASKGRNYILDRISTKYFVLLDDDFIFTRNTNLMAMYQCIETNKKIDIIGGTVYNKRRKVEYDSIFIKKGCKLYRVKVPYNIQNDLYFYDAVVDFFIAKTDSVRRVRWNDRLKTGEHTAFFLDCWREQLVVATMPEVSILHKRISLPFYNKFRKDRIDHFSKIFKNIYDIEEIIETKIQKK